MDPRVKPEGDDEVCGSSTHTYPRRLYPLYNLPHRPALSVVATNGQQEEDGQNW